MTLVGRLRALGIATAIGVLVWGLTGAGGASPREGKHAITFKGLRLLRHGVRAFEAQHGFLPGLVLLSDGTVEPLPEPGRGAMVAQQLISPRDVRGFPSWDGPFPGLLRDLPTNPFTGSRDIIIVPPGEDAVAFAATSVSGWAYLADWGHDAAGPLPPGTVLPCGTSTEAVDPTRGGVHSVQDIAFEIEDFQRWR